MLVNEIIELHNQGYRQDIVIADEIFTLAHELILHMSDKVDNYEENTTQDEEHEEGYSKEHYRKTGMSTEFSPSIEDTPKNSKMGKIYSIMKSNL